MSHPTIEASGLPWLTVAQMVEADRLAGDEFGITLLQMMENAGSALAELVTTLYPSGPLVVLAGGGNNGGGGMSAARHLLNQGRRVAVVLSSDRLGDAARQQLTTLERLGLGPNHDPPDGASVVVDALVGYGLTGALRGRAAALAAWTTGRPVVSLDMPSGHGVAGSVVADQTLTLALPKESLSGVRPLYLADIGLPAALWRVLGLDVGGLFGPGRILEVV